MASVFKTKVAMLDIIKKFADELSLIGFEVNVPKLNNDEGRHSFYIDDKFIGEVYFNYKKAQNKIKELKMSGDFSE